MDDSGNRGMMKNFSTPPEFNNSDYQTIDRENSHFELNKTVSSTRGMDNILINKTVSSARGMDNFSLSKTDFRNMERGSRGMKNFESHFEFNTDHRNMGREVKAPRGITQNLPNFRRLTRKYNPDSDSDATREDGAMNRFFKVMGEGSEKELKLPAKFCDSLDGFRLPYDTILISCKGMYAFKTKRCSCCHEFLVLTGEAWDSFIEDHNIKRFDLLWFEQTDQMVFRVTVCDRSTTCEKRPTLSPDEQKAARKRKRCMFEDGINIKGCTDCRFKARIEQHHLKHPYLTIPSKFLRGKSMIEKKRAILVNVPGHAWEVELHNYEDNRPDRSINCANMKLRKGWTAFFKSNGLNPGDVCVFAIDHNSPLTSSTSVVMNVYVTHP